MQKSSSTADPPANSDYIGVEAETVQGTVIACSTQAQQSKDPNKQKNRNPSKDKSSQLWTADQQLQFLTTSFSDSADTRASIHSYDSCKIENATPFLPRRSVVWIRSLSIVFNIPG